MLFGRGVNRTVLLALAWVLVGLNIVVFVQRSYMTEHCSVDQLLKTAAVVSVVVEDHDDRRPSTAGTSSTRPPVNDDDEDEFTGCERTNVSSSSSSSAASNSSIGAARWCMYETEVDLRVIVLTYKRSESLLKLLRYCCVELSRQFSFLPTT